MHTAAGRFGASLAPYTRIAIRAVCESAANYRVMLHDVLESRGMDTLPAHPAKIKAIEQAGPKDDRVGSTMLADLLRADTVYE